MKYAEQNIATPSAWRYRLAAWLIGGRVFRFSGRARTGEWRTGLIVAETDALRAFNVSYRYDANTMVDTNLEPA